jgi:hypothetical protein
VIHVKLRCFGGPDSFESRPLNDDRDALLESKFKLRTTHVADQPVGVAHGYDESTHTFIRSDNLKMSKSCQVVLFALHNRQRVDRRQVAPRALSRLLPFGESK